LLHKFLFIYSIINIFIKKNRYNKVINCKKIEGVIMNEIEGEMKKYEEIIVRQKLIETLREIRTLVNDKNYNSKNIFNKEEFIENINNLLDEERYKTIDDLDRNVGVIVSYIHAASNTQFKENEIIVSDNDNSIISEIGFQIECFIAPYELYSEKFDCIVISTNKKIVKYTYKKVKLANIDKFKEPFLKDYILLIIENLLYHNDSSIIMSSHSFFTGYLQGMSVINNICTEEEQKSYTRTIFHDIYDEFEVDYILKKPIL